MDVIDKLSSYLDEREKDQPGQQTRLAAHLNVSPGLVWQWLNRRTPIAAIHARGIEEYTDGRVTRYEVGPKVFGPPPQPSDATARILEELSRFLTDEEQTELRARFQIAQAAGVTFLRGLEPKYGSAITQVLTRGGGHVGGEGL